MRFGIGLGQGPDPEQAAVCAVRTARRSVPKPDLAVVFGSIHCDPKKVHRALCRELDPEILIGGTSYAEISPLGVTKKSVAVLLLDFEGAPVGFASAKTGPDPRATGLALARGVPRRPSAAGVPVGLFFSGIASGYENETLKATFMLELGGRLWSLQHKPSGRQLLEANPEEQP